MSCGTHDAFTLRGLTDFTRGRASPAQIPRDSGDEGIQNCAAMLHTTRLLVVGVIHAVADDPDALAELSCGDRDAAFALVAESDDDVFAFLTPDESGMSLDPNPEYAAPAEAREWSEDTDDGFDAAGEPVRFYFFCRNEEDRHWLHGACFAQPNGVGLAALEISPATGAGICLLRVPRGVRSISILTAE